MTHIRRFFFTGLFIIIFASCSPGKLLIMEANYFYSRSRYNDAIAVYLKALEYEDAAPYAEYGLGSVFYSLDEGKAALERFDNSKELLQASTPAEHRELRFRNNYNSGIVYFSEGDFSAAAGAFKNALREEPGRIDAKRNLELSQLALSRHRASENRQETPGEENEARSILFEYLRQKEQEQWKSRELDSGDQFSGPDY
jgi:Ca-activated chloride channel family protein